MTLVAFLILFTAVVIGYVLNLRAARALRDGGARMHSLDGFHGGYAALLVLVPTFALIIVWLLFQGTVIEFFVKSSLPDGQARRSGDRRGATHHGRDTLDRGRARLRYAGSVEA